MKPVHLPEEHAALAASLDDAYRATRLLGLGLVLLALALLVGAWWALG